MQSGVRYHVYLAAELLEVYRIIMQTAIQWLTSIEGVTCGAEGATFDFPLNLCLTRVSSLGFPGLDPTSTPS